MSLQLEALHALYNLCKISRTRQEAAAVAGVVPRLIALVSASPKVSACSSPHEMARHLSNIMAVRLPAPLSRWLSMGGAHLGLPHMDVHGQTPPGDCRLQMHLRTRRASRGLS